MPQPSHPTQPLARFPAEVQAAHERFLATRDPAALRAVVEAVLCDFAPPTAGRKPTPPLADGLRLIEDLSLDSIAITEIVFFFEDLFGVTINNKDLLAMTTLGALCGYVSTRIDEKRPPA